MAGEHYLALAPTRSLAEVRYPDLLVAFGVDPSAYKASNAYVISEQGKPPDFALEIASRRTGGEDTGPKREAYAALGIGEYWRFDETGRHHGARLPGERLVDGVYVAIEIEELPDGGLQGYTILKDNFSSILTIAPSELARRKSLAREQTMPNRKDPEKGQHRRNVKRRESR